MTRLGRAALAYAERLGWPVFPLRPRGKAPLIPEDAGGNGFLGAATDLDQIRRWWRCGDANIGIACSEASGLLVLDIDPRNGGDDELADLERQHGELPKTPLQLTGGGGMHYVFRRPRDVRFLGQLRGCEGIDVKANGYILGAPSVHPDGPLYRWEVSAHPLETPIADLPSWVMERVLAYAPDAEYGQPADDAAKSFLARAFAHAGWLGSRIDAVRINCWCPWENEHSQKSGSGGTVIFAPKSGGSGAGWFHCAHTSHGKKTMRDVMAVLPFDAVQKASADIVAEAAEEQCAALEYENVERVAIMEDT